MFISVKEAMELTGMSSTTIYRLCNKRINTLYIRKEDNKFLIDKEFILATFPPDVVKNTEPLESETFITQAKNDPEFEIIEKVSEKTSVLQLDIDDDFEKMTVNVSNSAPVAERIENESDNLLDQILEIQKNAVIENTIIENLEPVTEPETTKPQKKIKWEAIIGITISLLVISLLVYLLSLDIK